MKKNTIFILSIFIFLITADLFSQSSSPKETLKEFENVQVYKPSYGYLTVNMNYTVKTRSDQSEKIYQPYIIFDSNGKLCKNVAQSYFTPITITLAAGTYYIKSFDINGTEIKFAVEIQAGKTTLVE